MEDPKSEEAKSINNQSETNKFENKAGVVVGTYHDAPEFLQDNNYIKNGYRVNCNSLKKAIQSFFVLHNESVNVWSHAIGAITAIILIFYTAIFITAYKDTIMNAVDINFHYDSITNEILDFTKTIRNHLPDLDEAKKVYYNSFIASLANSTGNLFDMTKNKITSGYKESIESISLSMKKMKMTFGGNSTATNNIMQFFDDLNIKWNSITKELLDIIELHQLIEEPENAINPNIKKWPLFIMLSSAILCLGFSASFHLLSAISINVHKIFSALDYAGISLLIAGSCYPPYFYLLNCEPFLLIAYLSFISIFALGVFFFSLTPNFHTPKMRTIRGSLFLSLGISAGIPLIHLMIFGNTIAGFSTSPRLIFWYLGGASYIIGALMYINRIPEKFFPGKFDFFGSSHQIFHFLVVAGVLFHYQGSLDSYYFRVQNMCPAIK